MGLIYCLLQLPRMAVLLLFCSVTDNVRKKLSRDIKKRYKISLYIFTLLQETIRQLLYRFHFFFLQGPPYVSNVGTRRHVSHCIMM